jgi:hypothetical protein
MLRSAVTRTANVRHGRYESGDVQHPKTDFLSEDDAQSPTRAHLLTKETYPLSASLKWIAGHDCRQDDASYSASRSVLQVDVGRRRAERPHMGPTLISQPCLFCRMATTQPSRQEIVPVNAVLNLTRYHQHLTWLHIPAHRLILCRLVSSNRYDPSGPWFPICDTNLPGALFGGRL